MLSSEVTLPLGFRLFSLEAESSAKSFELVFLVGLFDEAIRLKEGFELEFPLEMLAPTDDEGIADVPLPPTVPMPARSALGYFFPGLLELLKAKFWTVTCALDSFCDEAMRKEP